jgi:hypothetical protein
MRNALQECVSVLEELLLIQESNYPRAEKALRNAKKVLGENGIHISEVPQPSDDHKFKEAPLAVIRFQLTKLKMEGKKPKEITVHTSMAGQLPKRIYGIKVISNQDFSADNYLIETK